MWTPSLVAIKHILDVWRKRKTRRHVWTKLNKLNLSIFSIKKHYKNQEKKTISLCHWVKCPLSSPPVAHGRTAFYWNLMNEMPLKWLKFGPCALPKGGGEFCHFWTQEQQLESGSTTPPRPPQVAMLYLQYTDQIKSIVVWSSWLIHQLAVTIMIGLEIYWWNLISQRWRSDYKLIRLFSNRI